ncbi:MAG: integration host factor subunit beta [Thermoanaerobaculum sp.]|nr:integration host factor subunit beta [Thermoanaerobaculum sp.]MCX7895711.1 integration host factor subunit beta [Thermoanaerobaculum sp.]MDW7968464.1 HU family DNA-binding protein [Thermoanaerobaculum sp.]
MIKADLVRAVKDVVDLPQNKAAEVVETIFDTLKEALLRGERIELRGFGVFLVKERKRGVGRNPRTGQPVPIPPGKTVRFKPGKALRELG